MKNIPEPGDEGKMKTLAAHNAERAKERAYAEQQRARIDNSMLSDILESERSVDMVNSVAAARAREAISEHRVEWVHVACDKCAFEMITYSGSDSSLLAMCPRCGYVGLLLR